jgi:hypothetical protein
MLLAPIAWADDDHGRGERGRGRGDDDARRVTVLVQSPAQVTVVQRRDDDDEDENEDREERVVVAPDAAAALVEAINNEVANLTNRQVENEDEDEDENEVEDVEVGEVAFISLGTLESNLADATSVTNAVNNNRAALLNFLNSGTPLANAIRTALTTAGIRTDLSNLLAVLVSRDDRLIAVTS